MGTNYDALMQCSEEIAIKNPHEELNTVLAQRKCLIHSTYYYYCCCFALIKSL